MIIHTNHGASFLPHHYPLEYRLYMLLDKLASRFCDYVVFVNHSERENYLRLGLVRPEQGLTIYNAVRSRGREVEESRSREVGQQSLTIGSTLRFSDQKNVIALTTYACKACARIPGLRFILLGDGVHYELCKAIVSSHQMSERILLPGWDSDIEPWLDFFDVFILYSRWEALPFSIIEAMEAGLPVIGSRIPSIMELVTEDVGWLVPLDDEPSFLAILDRIAQDPDVIPVKGQKALERVRMLCDYDAMVKAYRKLYENANGTQMTGSKG